MPISAFRPRTETIMVLATPTPPTSNATAPRLTSRAVKVRSVARWAASASD